MTAKLTGEFYVGQKVLMHAQDKIDYGCRIIFVPEMQGARFEVVVEAVIDSASCDWRNGQDCVGRSLYPTRDQLEPL